MQSYLRHEGTLDIIRYASNLGLLSLLTQTWPINRVNGGLQARLGGRTYGLLNNGVFGSIQQASDFIILKSSSEIAGVRLVEVMDRCTGMNFMRFLISILCRPTLAAILLCASIAAALGEDRSVADNRQDARLEWHSLANGRTEFDVSDPALVPRQLALAAEQSGCHYKDEIKELPVHFISVEKRRLAIVFCRLGVTGSHQMFDLADLHEPKLMELPFIAQKDGFGTTPRPGMITWKKDVGVLEAETGTDICPSLRLRHTYRPGFTDGWVSSSPTFVIARVEVMEYDCGASGRQGTWATVWEAPQWPKSVVVR